MFPEGIGPSVQGDNGRNSVMDRRALFLRVLSEALPQSGDPQPCPYNGEVPSRFDAAAMLFDGSGAAASRVPVARA